MIPKHILMCFILFQFALLGCGSKPVEGGETSGNVTTEDSFTPPQFVTQKTVAPTNDGVIIFVHGIFGDAKSTWLNAQSGMYFPKMVADDKVFKGFDVYSFGYNTPHFTQSLNIDELAENMRLHLEDADVFKYKKIVFVCHSMGGLVTRAFLIKYREQIASKTKMIYLFSTPSNGSEIASAAKFLSNNPQLLFMKVSDGDSYVDGQRTAWLSNSTLTQIPTFCAYEKRKSVGLATVVSGSSATALCNKHLDPIDADHLHIANPIDNKADSYIALRNAFKEVFNGANESTPVSVAVLDSKNVSSRNSHTAKLKTGTNTVPVVSQHGDAQHILSAPAETTKSTKLLIGQPTEQKEFVLQLSEVVFDTPPGDNKDDDTQLSVMIYNSVREDTKYGLFVQERNEQYRDPSTIVKRLSVFNKIAFSDKDKVWVKVQISPNGNDHWRTRLTLKGVWSDGKPFSWTSQLIDVDQDRKQYAAPISIIR